MHISGESRTRPRVFIGQVRFLRLAYYIGCSINKENFDGKISDHKLGLVCYDIVSLISP